MIIAFIFLTPKTWFDSTGKIATREAVSVVKAQDFSNDKQIGENHFINLEEKQ